MEPKCCVIHSANHNEANAEREQSPFFSDLMPLHNIALTESITRESLLTIGKRKEIKKGKGLKFRV